MKLLYLSDLHFEEDSKSYNDALALVESERPDVLLIGGDFGSRDLAVSFLRECSKYCSQIVGILGNNDEFELDDEEFSNVTILDAGIAKISDNVAVLGISRNIGLKPKKYRLTVNDFLKYCRELYECVRKFCDDDVKILLLHDVPIEVAEVAVVRGIIQKFSEIICGSVSDCVQLLDPDVVLVGHLHAGVLTVEKGHTLFIVSTWVRYRYFTEISIEDGRVVVRVGKFPEGESVFEKVLVR